MKSRYLRGSNIFSTRLKLLGLLSILLLLVLVGRLGYVQILSDQDYEELAYGNTIRTVQEPATRGRILDRNGKILVTNKVIKVLAVDSNYLKENLSSLDERVALARKLAAELPGVTASSTEIQETLSLLSENQASHIPYLPVLDDVSSQLSDYVLEQGEQFPGLEIVERSVRAYPYGNTAAHILGYVTPPGNLGTDQSIPAKGITGIELAFNQDLTGTPGTRTYKVDVNFNVVDQVSYIPPTPGKDIQLTIDIDAQRLLETELQRGLLEARQRSVSGTDENYPAPAGAAVILDTDGANVLAMASYPTYDIAEFNRGVSSSRWLEINQDKNAPLLNRAIQGLYPPGSSIKPLTAFSALDSGLIGETGYIGVNEKFLDTGTLVLEDCEGRCEFSNPQKQPMGELDLRTAITVSSDVYFYEIAEKFYILPEYDPKQIQETFELFGLGSSTGIALPDELAGNVPQIPPSNITQIEIPQTLSDTPLSFESTSDWEAGDTLNLSIGQGDLLVTPLQLANAYVALANGGTLYSPQIVLAVTNPESKTQNRVFKNRVKSQIRIPQEIHKPIIDGMLGATSYTSIPSGANNPAHTGTAYEAFLDFPHSGWPVAGKTGTSEISEKTDTALFVAFGPNPQPEYVIAAVLEESGFGGVSAAPVVRRVLDALVLPQLELPSLIQTAIDK